ncbi:DUF4279 domain-containing protein [Nocardia brasiliensis]|uniref:DUF4279 domain-containing protein n=1 Tax=Nocardia brasiliensis TaxID=37326 RepID=UPI00367128A0
MRIRQYVYFALFSSETTADEMTTRLSIAPDEIGIAGSKRTSPPIPAEHAWMVSCRDSGLCVDEQITKVMDRLLPRQAQIVALARELERNDPVHGGAKLSVVRYLNDEDGDEEQLNPPDARFQKLPGQHQLLGWALEPVVMRFLVAANAAVDVDEYS